MLAAQFLEMERSVEQAMRWLSERAELCRFMMEKVRNGEAKSPTRWKDALSESLDQTAPLGELLTREWIYPDGDGLVNEIVLSGSADLQLVI